jgi:hypothetical protein
MWNINTFIIDWFFLCSVFLERWGAFSLLFLKGLFHHCHNLVHFGLCLSPGVLPDDLPIPLITYSDADDVCLSGGRTQTDLELISEGSFYSVFDGENCKTEATRSTILDGYLFGSHRKIEICHYKRVLINFTQYN